MAEPVILTWNAPNWITVVLMVGLAYFIVAAASKAWQSRKGNQPA
jgi:hypothetical protein